MSIVIGFFGIALFFTFCCPEPTVAVIAWIFFLGILIRFKKAYNEDKAAENAMKDLHSCKNPKLQKKLKEIYVKHKVLPPDFSDNPSEQKSSYTGRSIAVDTVWINPDTHNNSGT